MKKIETEMNLVQILENEWEVGEKNGEILLYDRDNQDVRMYHRNIRMGDEAYISFGLQLWGEKADWEDTFELEIHRVGGEIESAAIKLVAASDSQTPAWFSRKITYDSQYGRVVGPQVMVEVIPIDEELVELREMLYFEYGRLPKEINIEETAAAWIKQLEEGKFVRPTLVRA